MKFTEHDIHKWHHEPMHELRLSEHNLLSLISKLYTKGSVCSIDDPTGTIRVVAEYDETHYGKRVPGIMHPTTEAFVKDLKEFLETHKTALE